MMWRSIGLIWLAFFCFGAAQAGDSDMTDPPFIVATTDCASGFETYRRALLPFYFVLSQDGKLCTYSYCMGGCRKNTLRSATLIYCQQSNGHAPCEVYAYGGRVISTRVIELQDRGTR